MRYSNYALLFAISCRILLAADSTLAPENPTNFFVFDTQLEIKPLERITNSTSFDPHYTQHLLAVKKAIEEFERELGDEPVEFGKQDNVFSHLDLKTTSFLKRIVYPGWSLYMCTYLTKRELLTFNYYLVKHTSSDSSLPTEQQLIDIKDEVRRFSQSNDPNKGKAGFGLVNFWLIKPEDGSVVNFAPFFMGCFWGKPYQHNEALGAHLKKVRNTIKLNNTNPSFYQGGDLIETTTLATKPFHKLVHGNWTISMCFQFSDLKVLRMTLYLSNNKLTANETITPPSEQEFIEIKNAVLREFEKLSPVDIEAHVSAFLKIEKTTMQPPQKVDVTKIQMPTGF